MMQALLWCSLAVLFYIYAGYPALLKMLARARGRPVRKRDITPAVSLIISAHNEAAVIRGKLENALMLDYPPHLLEIVVVSDASSDGTDDIVREYQSRGVVLCVQAVRKGKTAGLNAVVPERPSEIVVFSDANALYEPDAIRKLVRNFDDPQVGCVTGEARYLEGNRSAADAGERAYWDYEMQLKRLETAITSMVGGDGAIYAIRRHLWRELPENAINDFLNPLQIVAAGWRAVYESEAVCHEETAGGTRQEYRRRVRIVSRSWRAVCLVPGLLNPFRSGLFALALFSHKVLRWLSGLFFVMAAIGLAGVIASTTDGFGWIALGAAALSISGWLVSRRVRRLTAFVGYFAVVTAASLAGVFNGITGRVSGVWSTVRQGIDIPVAPAPLRSVVWASVLLIACSPLVALIVLVAGVSDDVARYTVWIPLGVLAYVYAGYPATLYLAGPFLQKPVRRGAVSPSVCILITANDEEDVIEAKLRNTLEVDYPRDLLEIVVASDGSVDATNSIVRTFAGEGVKLIDFRTRRGKIAAINGSVPQVSSDIIVFSDANTFLATGAVKALVRNFADPNVGAVSGDVVLLGDRASLGRSEDLYYRYERWLQRAESAIGSMVGVDGALHAIRRDLFISPPSDTVLDDMAIPMTVAQSGHRVVFEAEALAYEQGPRTAVEEFWRRVRISAGGVQYLIRSDSPIPAEAQLLFSLVVHKALRWLTFSFAALAFVSAVRLSQDSGIFFAFVIGHFVLLLLGIAGCVPALRRWRPIGLVHYFCLVQTATACGLVRGLRNRQPVAWERFARAPLKIT
jgi:cellulose synthase/poly-beta-1,6-N-acetylglucosamine synthase-like glycosyltransferase